MSSHNILTLKEIYESIGAFKDIYQTLQEDFIESGDWVIEDPSNFRLRTYIRTFFAFVEGTLYGMKQVALKMHEHKSCFTEAEVTLLKEVTYEIADRGRVREKTKFIDTINNVRFTVASIEKAVGLSCGVSFDEKGWQSFQDSLQIRHQITHPKNASSLIISELDNGQGKKVDIIVDASDWYSNLIKQLSNNLTSAIRTQYKDPLTKANDSLRSAT
jgi:hypothetical protein